MLYPGPGSSLEETTAWKADVGGVVATTLSGPSISVQLSASVLKVYICVMGSRTARISDRRSLSRIDVIRGMASNTRMGAWSRGRVGSN